MVTSKTPVSRSPKELLAPIYQELTEYSETMKKLGEQDTDDALLWISSISARVLELTYYSLDNDNPYMQRLRAERLKPLGDELKFQFQIFSRRHALTRFEWEVAR